MTYQEEIATMRLMKLLPIVILSLAGTMAVAKDKDNKYDDVNCSKLDNNNLRKECREEKWD
jgi:hypothetical protein